MISFIGCSRFIDRDNLSSDIRISTCVNYTDVWRISEKTRYPIVFRTDTNTTFYKDLDMKDIVTFGNKYEDGSGVISTYDDKHTDENNEGIIAIYNIYKKEIGYFGISARDHRFGGIIIVPMYLGNFKKYRKKFLIKKLQKITPIIGRAVILFNNLYNHVHYKPNADGMRECEEDFNKLIEL